MAQKAIKGKALDNHLVENPVENEYKTLWTHFLDKEVLFVEEDIIEAYLGWRIFFDRALNFKGSGIGVVLVS